MPPRSPAQLADRLDRLPLLGAGAEVAAETCVALAAGLRAAPDPVLEVRLTLATGTLARLRQHPRAVPQLARAARLAEEADQPALARRARAEVARALVGEGRAAVAERLRDELGGPLDDPATDPDVALVDLDLGWLTEPVDLQRLLDALPSPARDHDRVAVLRALAERWQRGGDRHLAAGHLQAALELARRAADDVLTLDLSLSSAALLLEGGDRDAAEDRLCEALDLALQRDDTLAQVAAASLLAGVRLGREDWAGAAEAAEVELAAAERRQSWLAVADAALTLSTCLLHADEPAGAVQQLVQVGAELRARGSRGGVNLIKGRLGELRVHLGPTVFDPLLWSA